MRPLLTSTSTDEGRATPSQLDNNTTSASLEVSEAIKVKTLYEKMRQFRIDVEEKQDRLTLRRIYVAQALTQSGLSLLFLILNACFYSKLNKTVRCDIDDIITENYSYFKCSNVLVPYFQVTLVIFYFFIVPYFLLCSFSSFWAFSKMKKNYDFKEAHTHNRQTQFEEEEEAAVPEEQIGNYTLLLSEISPARGDLAFMLYLLDKYDKLYSLRFAVFLSVKNKKKLQDFILTKDWPIERLQMYTEDNGRSLNLTKLRGIPKAVFFMKMLDVLILEDFTLTDDDFDLWYWKKLLGLRTLSLIRCCLTSIPAAILELVYLQTLDLSLNRIRSIPEEIRKLSALRNLNIASNNVTKGVEHIFAMENLIELNLCGNNYLQLSPSCQLTLTRLYVDEAMVAQMTEETRSTLTNVMKINVPRALDNSVMQYSRVPDRAPPISFESPV